MSYDSFSKNLWLPVVFHLITSQYRMIPNLLLSYNYSQHHTDFFAIFIHWKMLLYVQKLLAHGWVCAIPGLSTLDMLSG